MIRSASYILYPFESAAYQNDRDKYRHMELNWRFQFSTFPFSASILVLLFSFLTQHLQLTLV